MIEGKNSGTMSDEERKKRAESSRNLIYTMYEIVKIYSDDSNRNDLVARLGALVNLCGEIACYRGEFTEEDQAELTADVIGSHEKH